MLPPLRKAMREGRISYEKARLIAWKATDTTVEQWIERVAGKTCIALRREIEGEEEAQMWAVGWLKVPVPRHTVELFTEVCRVARALARKPLTSGECFLWAVQHFLETWEAAAALGRRRKVIERDLGYCQVPGCSRAAQQEHHVTFRSHGGSDDMSNKTAVCATHHLRGIHDGYLRVSGRAPDELVWEPGPLARPPPGIDWG